MPISINSNYPCSEGFYAKGRTKPIKYIVIHYVGATGSALQNALYFSKKPERKVSAHYFVGHKSENAAVYKSVDDKDTAWHCGTDGNYKHAECRNSNSIGIELCCHKDDSGNWYFDNETVLTAAELTLELMKKYGVKSENVLRHYDVTGKICPEPFVRSITAWDNFKSLLKGQEENIITEKDNIPADWAKEAVEWGVKNGIIKGDTNGNLKLSSNLTRQEMLVMLYRFSKL